MPCLGQACGKLYKEHGPGYHGGNGKAGEFEAWYEDGRHPGYCCPECDDTPPPPVIDNSTDDESVS